jgi:hypothetical protein
MGRRGNHREDIPDRPLTSTPLDIQARMESKVAARSPKHPTSIWHLPLSHHPPTGRLATVTRNATATFAYIPQPLEVHNEVNTHSYCAL